MERTWELLEAAGLPVGAPRSPAASLYDRGALRAAVLDAVHQTDDDPRRLEPLAAWLAAWRHHWPVDFRARFGPESESMVDRLRARVRDRNRYLKLRRIAIENLSG